MTQLWDGFLQFLAHFVTPDWGLLVAMLPLGLAGIAGLFLLVVAAVYATAGPTRRGRRRMRPVPPPGVHQPEPTFAPILVALGAAILFFGIVFRGPVLVAGLVATIGALLFWGREAVRDYSRLRAHDAAAAESGAGSAADAAAHGAGEGAVNAAGLRPLQSLAGPPPPRLRPGIPVAELGPGGETAAAHPGLHMPAPSFRPLLVSLAVAVLFAGLVFGTAILIAGILMLAITLVGWLGDARTEYRDAVAAERSGRHEPQPRPRAPVGTLALFAVVVLVAVGFRSGLFPLSIPAVPTPPQPTAGPAAAVANPSGSAAAPGSSGAAPGGAGSTALQVGARAIKFETTSLTAPANTAFTIAFNNQDAGIPHDIVIHKDSASGDVVFTGDAFPGPATKTYAVKALPAGTYAFICSIHPQTMQGTLTVR